LRLKQLVHKLENQFKDMGGDLDNMKSQKQESTKKSYETNFGKLSALEQKTTNPNHASDLQNKVIDILWTFLLQLTTFSFL